TSSAWWPTTAIISRALSGWHARTTCSISERPPTRCSTFARADFSRVPLPAARITITKSEVDILILSAVHARLTTNGDTIRREWHTSARGLVLTPILTY